MGDMDLDPRPSHQREQGTGGPAKGRVATPSLTDRMHAGSDALRERYRNLPPPARYALVALLIAFFAALPFLMPYITQQETYYDGLLLLMAIGSLLALGLNVVVGFAGLLDLGYVAFFAVGAYSYAFLSGAARYSVAIHDVAPNAASLQPHWQPYFWLFFPAAIIIALVTGVLLGAPTLRLRGDYLAIVTLGFGEIVRIVANNLDSRTGGPRGVQS